MTHRPAYLHGITAGEARERGLLVPPEVPDHAVLHLERYILAGDKDLAVTTDLDDPQRACMQLQFIGTWVWVST